MKKAPGMYFIALLFFCGSRRALTFETGITRGSMANCELHATSKYPYVVLVHYWRPDHAFHMLKLPLGLHSIHTIARPGRDSHTSPSSVRSK